jgi:hypothetical protein
MRTPTAVLISVTVLGGCVSHASNGVWYRADGRTIPTNPALLAQAKLDTTICEGEAEKIFATSNQAPSRRQESSEIVMRACMAQRGYVFRPD